MNKNNFISFTISLAIGFVITSMLIFISKISALGLAALTEWNYDFLLVLFSIIYFCGFILLMLFIKGATGND